MSVSVVIPTRNEGPRVHGTVSAVLRGLPGDGEIVVVDDASTDGSTEDLEEVDPRVRVHRAAGHIGAAAARNLGAMSSSGDLLIFADAHVEPLGPWLAALRACASSPSIGAVSPVLENWDGAARGYGLRMVDVGTSVEWLDRRGSRAYPVALLPGFFLAIRRRVFVATGRFDECYHGWGMEDLDFCVRLWTLGYENLVVPDIVVRHFSKHSNPPDYQCDWAANLRNILVFGAIHYRQRRWRELLEHYDGHAALSGAVDYVERSGVRDLRAPLRAVRLRDDDDLFDSCARG